MRGREQWHKGLDCARQESSVSQRAYRTQASLVSALDAADTVIYGEWEGARAAGGVTEGLEGPKALDSAPRLLR